MASTCHALFACDVGEILPRELTIARTLQVLAGLNAKLCKEVWVVERGVQLSVEPQIDRDDGANLMKKFKLDSWLLGSALFLSAWMSPAAISQTGSQTGNAAPNANIFVVRGDVNAPLANDWWRADAVSLNATRAQIAPETANALENWVRDGGVVFLHTDAAQMFGFETVPARIGTPQLAGQLYGRARAAVLAPIHPLLSGASDNTAPDQDGSLGTLGVETVYYRMQPGDVLVTRHDAGVPLLEVTDLAVADNGPPLYAAAIAPYGRGWAVFTPDTIETERADGALFARNLAALALGRVRTPVELNGATANGRNGNGALANSNLPPIARGDAAMAMTSLPAALLETPDLTPAVLLGAINNALNFSSPADARANDAIDGAPATDTPNVDAPQRVLMLSRGEVTALGQMTQGAARDAATENALRATLDILRARLELQRMAPAQAARLLDSAAQLVPQSAEVALWDGVLNAARAADRLQSSRDRAVAWRAAAASWNRALQSPPLWNNAQTQNGNFISGIDRRQIEYWRAQAGRAAALSAVEPPLVTPLGRGRDAVLLRHYPNDAIIVYAEAFGRYVVQSQERFGWRAPNEEILSFPNEGQLQAYRAAAGLNNTPAPNPLARYGDIQGTRILMVSQPAIPVNLSTALLGGGIRGQVPIATLGDVTAAVLSRFHAQVLVNALTQDGSPVPGWIPYGIIATSTGQSVRTGNFGLGVPVELLRFARLGLLWTPRQFDRFPLPLTENATAEAQAGALLATFYERFGRGAVVQTLQRIGSGENIDSALEATTNLNEEQFFRAWARNIAP